MIHLANNILIKYENHDFIVDEISLINQDLSNKSFNNTYTILNVKKSGFTTFECIDYLSEYLHIPRIDINCQGLKDEDGITSQVISVKKILATQEIVGFNKLYKSVDKWILITILGFSKHAVREKSLHGNIFTLTLRNLPGGIADKVIDNCRQGDFGCLNYYDQQRFGLPNQPVFAHLIGESLAKNDLTKSEEYYRQSGNSNIDFPGEIPDGDLLEKIDTRKKIFFLGAYSSLMWNKKLSDQIESTKALTIFAGHDVKIIENKNQLLPYQLESNAFKLDSTGQIMEYQKVRNTILYTTFYPSNKSKDEFFKDHYKLDIQFLLPTGSYATMVVKQFVLSCV